jgi:peptidoglycan/LPS O-acetylase OafA/YrhL
VWIVIAPLLDPSSPVRKEALAVMSRDQLWYWTYLSNWKMGFDNRWPPMGTSVYWSLAIEEQFYVVWPAVVLLLRTRVLRGVCVGIIAAAFAIRTIQLAAGASPLLVYVGTFSRMDGLAAGAFVSLVLRDPLERERAQRLAPWLLMLGAASLVGIWIWIGVFSEFHPLMQTVGFTALAITFGSLIVKAVTPGSRVGDLFRAPVLRFFGRYSYAMYLFHETLVLQIVPHLPQQWILPGEMGAQATRFVVSMSATITLAWLSWHLLEKHFLALKPRFAN